MKTIMLVEEDTDLASVIQTYALEADIDVIHAKDSRQGVTMLNDNPNVNLVLVRTKNPETNTPAYISIKPSANLKTPSSEDKDFLQKPFSKDQWKAFIEQQL